MPTEHPGSRNVYLDDYSQEHDIARYLSQTAGVGVAYVLEHVYGPIYSEVMESLITQAPGPQPFRVLEYGCGGGMNLLRMIELLQARGAKLDRAFGTDFSPP